MATGLGNVTGGLESLLGLNTTAGTSQLQDALAALQAVGVPTTQQLTLPQLQQYVSAGVLSPAQYQAIAENPQAYQQALQANENNTGLNAQTAALAQLGNVAQNGSTPIMQAQTLNNINQTNQAMQAARQGIAEQAAQRGVANGGLTLIQQLMNEQANAQNANSNAVNIGANNAQLALNALAQQGQLGTSIQGQTNQQAQAAAQAAQQIAQYNSQLQSAANQYNTQNANQAQAANLANAQALSNANTQNANARTQYNAMVPQTEYQDQLQKAQQEAGIYGQQAGLAEQQAQNQNNFTGSLIGAGATLGGDYLMGNAIGNAYGNNSGASNTSYNPNTDFSTPPNGYNMASLPNPTTNNPYAMGGEVKGYCSGGMCYAKGGEVHDHAICMKMGGPVPGKAKMPGNNPKNDTVPAMLSPHEIVLPRTVSQAPNAPQKAAQFVAQTKGQPMPSMTPTVNSFAEALKKLEENGLELRLTPKGA